MDAGRKEVIVHEVLPHHLTVRIFEQLSTKERACLSVVCKTWRQLSLENWSKLELSFKTLAELEAQRRWLDMVASHGAQAVSSVQMHWHGGQLLHPAAGSLHIEQFINLKRLNLKPPNSAYWAINPKAMKGLANLTQLEELVVVFSPFSNRKDLVVDKQVLDVTLEQFAIFAKLRLLSVTLQPSRGWESGWNLTLSPALQVLKRLKTLVIAHVAAVQVNLPLVNIVSKLSHLDLCLREPLTEALFAPQLQCLRYLCCKSTQLPFCGATQLQELVYNGDHIQFHNFSAHPNLNRLSLGPYLEDINAAFVKQLTCLQRLREVKLMYYDIPGDLESLEVFAPLKGLETLHLNTVVPERAVYHFSPLLRNMTSLKELKITSHSNGLVRLGSGLEYFPALERFHMEVRDVSIALDSSTICHLSLEGIGGYIMSSYPHLGNLPKLQSLRLKLLPNMKDCGALVDKLAEMSRLRELFLTIGYADCPGSVRRALQLPIQSEPSGTLEQMLNHIKQLRNLRVLQVAAVNDDVTLSRRILPGVEHLSIACRGLGVCTSCMPWRQKTLNLIFTNTSQFTIDDLQTCHNVEFFEGNDSRLDGVVYRARILDKGNMPYDFGDDLFDDCPPE